MVEYVGKTCPYCKTVFAETDDIVVCSVCDMPHHKDCWIENKGCTTFGCLGTINAPGASANSTVTQKEMRYDDVSRTDGQGSYCIKCGSLLDKESSFCGKCGNPVYDPGFSKAPSTVENGYQPPFEYNQFRQDPQHDVTVFIGDNADFYTKKFSELWANNTTVAWNWCAFLFAPFWFIYRKMYDYGVIILGSYFLLLLIGFRIQFVLSSAASVLFGIFGNQIYLKKLENYSNRSMQMSDFERNWYIAAHQGTNLAAAIISAVAYGTVAIVIFAIRI